MVKFLRQMISCCACFKQIGVAGGDTSLMAEPWISIDGDGWYQKIKVGFGSSDEIPHAIEMGVHLVVGGDIEATGGAQGRRGITPTQRPTKIKKLM
jgi:hypothetical protein